MSEEQENKEPRLSDWLRSVIIERLIEEGIVHHLAHEVTLVITTDGPVKIEIKGNLL